MAHGQDVPPPPPPPSVTNDHCVDAIPIQVGQRISMIDNETATVSSGSEAPGTIPVTCIQTLENDLWYSFTTESEFELYEITIATAICSTPAGLQALLIRSEGCNNEEFIYQGCSNKQTMDTIKLFLKNPGPGQRHLIYIDGYDGTICQFDLWITGKEKIRPLDYRYLRFDYDLSESPYGLPDGLETVFQNNFAEMSWTGSPEDETAYYIVERWVDDEGIPEGSNYYQVVGIIDPENFVGPDELQFTFVDFLTEFEDARDYVYRIISVGTDGERRTSERFLIRSRLIQDFFVSRVQTTRNPSVYQALYINRRKKQDFHLTLRNEAGKVIKDTWLRRVTDPEGTINLQMEEMPEGKYYFRMDNGEDAFEHSFIHQAPSTD